ncbi:hypothetical protein M404DRAFT_999271 [Pisolithus tinctorius Marx 270]|uniref:Uncharacterized protein n=1 Tax=Pisolithus tinctorius Marx 270 TaxID=870435 RepID=A0A0C3PD82_PISTI|nr:hypothetical protein M404DRAFT_999271 [Pisolithus tinctorius Marx 270]
MSSFAPVAVTRHFAEATTSADLNAELGSLTGDMTGLGTMIEATPSPATFHMDPEKAKKYLENIEKFRVLVIGRGNAGKMTILQRVCNSVDEPDVFDEEGKKHGYHEIKHELVFKSNPGFVFHDSPGFEAGSAKQFEEMKRFVMDHAVERTLKKHIHAIWYCIPMTDYCRTVTVAEQKFFNECDTGHVPVVVLLTRADALNFVAMEELLDEGLEVEEAEERATEREYLLLEKWQAHIKQILDKCKFPPKIYLPLTKMHNESADCTTLIQCTASALNEEGLQRLLLSTQQSSIGLCIEYAVHWVVAGMIEKVIKRGKSYDRKGFECCLLNWFPKHDVSV